MIKIEKVKVYGLKEAIRGMRNPMNSWDRSDSIICSGAKPLCPVCETNHENRCYDSFIIGDNDHELMINLAAGGPVHAKYRRMITVYLDITAPLYWWKEFDTYKVGTVANSCSTMHKIHAKEFELDDFSHEHLLNDGENGDLVFSSIGTLENTIDQINACRTLYLKTNDKKYWWQMIQLLPSSYNQLRTVMLNYEVLAGTYPMRKDHKLDEWREFCQWIETLPYSEIITRKEETEK